MIKFMPLSKIHHPVLVLLTQNQLEKKNVPEPVRDAAAVLSRQNVFKARFGEIFPLVRIGRPLVVFVGLGPRKDLSPSLLRTALHKAVSHISVRRLTVCGIIPYDESAPFMRALIEGIIIGGYRFTKYRTNDDSNGNTSPSSVIIHAPHKPIYDQWITVAEGVNFTRDLVNSNADEVTSLFFEKTVKGLVKKNRAVTVTILGEKELKKEGLNLHLAVNAASQKPPRLIIVRYKGTTTGSPFKAIVGKGMTFDTGGLNLKPSGHIETMKCDMSGAAAVIGTLRNVLELKPACNAIFAMGLAENAIGPGAYKPGDVIRSHSGKTVEIGNTDAEGRLVLADAMAYLIKHHKPCEIVDIATLTGACVVGLGLDYTGLMATDDNLAKRLETAAAETDDRVWRLPLYPELSEYMKSQIADIKNISNIRSAGGAITAAEFLRQFVHPTPWAHLDIAGTAYVEQTGRLYYGAGATGAGVRLLTHYLCGI